MTDETSDIDGSYVGGHVEVSQGSTFAGHDLVQYNFTFQVAPFRPPPDLAALRAAYTDYLLSAHRYLDFKGVPQVEKVATLLPLEEVFVPLHARPTAPEADTWRQLRLAGREMGELEEAMRLEGVIAPAESAGPIPIDEALNKEAALVILGDPGAGKSTLLKHLALHLSRDGDGPLPILLPLNAYAEALGREEIGLQAYLARYYAARRSELAGVEALFDEALAKGQAVVLLDGLDEVQARRLFVNRLVEDFVAAHRAQAGNRFVVSSRIVGYRDAPLVSTIEGRAWPVYTLTDWGREEIERFAARWTLAFELATHGDTPEARAAAEAEQQDLLAAIVPGSGIERLACNPLLLTIMALIKRQRVTLPRERVRLYELYLETLISAWNKARALDRRPAGPEISYLETVQVLAPLALWLREENPTAGLVSREQVEGWLTGYYQQEWGEPRGPARQRARAFLQGVRRYSNLLVERGEGRYGFLHLTFEEMLAAKGIALVEDQEGLEAAMDVVCQHWLDPAWRETLLLTAGVLGIVKQSPFKAGRMLRQLCAEDLAGEDRGRNVVLAGQALAEKRDRPFWWGDEKLGSPLCPVVGVSWFEAQAYCRWLALEAGLDPDSPVGPRLPAEEEWERAVRGTDGREYPWGDKWDRTWLNCADWWAGRELPESDDWVNWMESDECKEANPTPTAVVTFQEGITPSGLWDGAGNVWEWTGSLWQRGSSQRVLRGGSWVSSRRDVRCAYRYLVFPDYYNSLYVGFRVVFPGSLSSDS